MASSIGCFPLFPDEKAGNHQKRCGEGKPGDGVFQVVVAQLDFGAGGAGKAVGTAAGKLLQDEGGDFHVRGNGHGREHGGHIPPIPEVAISIIVGTKTKLRVFLPQFVIQ